MALEVTNADGRNGTWDYEEHQVSLDDDAYRNARIKAAAMDTSVSALVKRYLTELGTEETEFQRLKRQEQELRERNPG